MKSKKPYGLFICKECEIDFLVQKKRSARWVNCPLCADHIYVEKINDLWFERQFNHLRPWTAEEDEIVVLGKQQGHTHREIAGLLHGRTKRAVDHRVYHLRKLGRIRE